MVSFPRAPHDDMIDAVGNGVAHFLHSKATVGIPAHLRR